MAIQPSGNSSDRRKIRRIASEVKKILAPNDLPTPKTEIVQGKIKFAKIWNSTPAWGAIGMLIGAVASQISISLLCFGVWCVLCAEFIHIKIAERSNLRWLLNAAFAVLLAGVFIFGWPLLPKPKEQPSFDASLQAFGQKLPSILGINQAKPRASSVAPTRVPPSSVEAPAIQRLSNLQLRARVIDLTKEIRKIGADEKINYESIRSRDWSAWTEIPEDQKQKKQEAWNKIAEDEQTESTYFDFQVRQMYLGVATEYRDELLRRLPPQKPLSLNNKMTNLFWDVENNRPINSYSIEPTAQYLEVLARQLPQ